MPSITLYRFQSDGVTGELHSHEDPMTISQHRGCVRVGEFVPASAQPEGDERVRLAAKGLLAALDHDFDFMFLGTITSSQMDGVAVEIIDEAMKCSRQLKEPIDNLRLALANLTEQDEGQGLAAELILDACEVINKHMAYMVSVHNQEEYERLAVLKAKLAATHKDNPTTGGTDGLSL